MIDRVLGTTQQILISHWQNNGVKLQPCPQSNALSSYSKDLRWGRSWSNYIFKVRNVKKKQNRINGVKHYYICFLWVLLSFFLKVNFSWTGNVFPHSLSHHCRYLYNNDNNAKGSGAKPFGERMKVTLTFSCLVSTTRSHAAKQNCWFSCTFKYV